MDNCSIVTGRCVTVCEREVAHLSSLSVLNRRQQNSVGFAFELRRHSNGRGDDGLDGGGGRLRGDIGTYVCWPLPCAGCPAVDPDAMKGEGE